MVPRLFRGVQEVKGTSVWSTHPHSQQLELQQSLKQLTEAIYGTYAQSYLHQGFAHAQFQIKSESKCKRS